MRNSLSHNFDVGGVQLGIYSSKQTASQAAAAKAAAILPSKGSASSGVLSRIIIGTGNSQEDLIKMLTQMSFIDWSSIEVFHMDEYVGIAVSHPASFRRWLKTHLTDIVQPRKVHYLDGDAADLNEECRRYGNLLRSAPIDVCFLGFGENGHIAFNDPPNADFNDPHTVKRVTLDAACRMQQVGEGHFTDLGTVPREALTITCPFLVSAKSLICCVPDLRKARAVRDALEGPLSPSCPASLVREHPQTFVFLDNDSASLLTMPGKLEPSK